MLSRNKRQALTFLPLPIKERLEDLRKVDPVIYSESRVIWRCIEAHLQVVEKEAKSFNGPTYEAPSPRKRRTA